MVQQTRRRLPGLRHVVARRRVAVALRVATVARVARCRQSRVAVSGVATSRVVLVARCQARLCLHVALSHGCNVANASCIAMVAKS